MFDKSIQQLFAIVRTLRLEHPERRFPLDGMLVGDLGEVMVASRFGLELLPQSEPGRDAVAPDGREVEIKATAVQKNGGFAFRDHPEQPRSPPAHVIAIRIIEDGTIDVIYNGAGERLWPLLGKLADNGQRRVAASQLAKLMDSIDPSEQLAEVE